MKTRMLFIAGALFSLALVTNAQATDSTTTAADLDRGADGSAVPTAGAATGAGTVEAVDPTEGGGTDTDSAALGTMGETRDADRTVIGTIDGIDRDNNTLTIRDEASGTERTVKCATIDPSLKEGDRISATVTGGNEATSVTKA